MLTHKEDIAYLSVYQQKAPARGRFLVGAMGLVGLVEADAGYVSCFDGVWEVVGVL